MKTSIVTVAIIALILGCSLGAGCQTRTTPVEVTNAPEVSVTNTPDVSVVNSPMVKIDPSANQVSAAGRYQLLQFWSTDQVVAAGAWLWGNPFDCGGYRELRFSIITNSSSPSVKVAVQFQYPDMSYKTVGNATLGTTSNPITQQANFTQTVYNCHFCIPTMSNVCRIIIMNDSTASVTIWKASAVYMVD